MQGEISLKERMKQSKMPVRAYHEIVIKASKETVWGFLSDLTKWNLWKEIETPVVITGTKWDVGTRFRWKRGIFTITAEIVDIEPPNRVRWNGKVRGIEAKHYWILKKANSGTLVATYEEWSGIIPKLFKGRSQQRLEETLRRDLEGLKRATESFELEHTIKEGLEDLKGAAKIIETDLS